MGQPCPASTCDQVTNPAARATWAPGRSTAHGAPWSPWPTATCISSW